MTGTDARAADPTLVDIVRRLKVGGSFWAAQPELPQRYVLVRDFSACAAAELSEEAIVLWDDGARGVAGASLIVRGECDPWHMLSRATMLVTGGGDELCLVASVLGVPVRVWNSATQTLATLETAPEVLLTNALAESYENPFTGAAMSAREAVELCAFWRRLIDSNRDIGGGLGFAFWKQEHVAPLLWSCESNLRFLRSAEEVDPCKSIAVWRAKVPADELASLESRKVPLIEVEDGFVRSQGLGADCVPPLSITVDRLGAYFDPAQPSELELLLENGTFDGEMLSRAAKLRERIIEAGLGKYQRATGNALERPHGKRRHILVPGQVEDDRAVQSGGCGLVSNLDLLARVRAQAPDAYILYKPHPDVLAGHRRGAIAERACLEHADEIVADGSISSLIEMVDEVHVNTSLTGFEALLREKPVTTYGVPFYAGWGLTRDLGPVPSRRSARRTLDELVAAALLIYPRYLDPVTRLPCPAEVLVERLGRDPIEPSGLLVLMRRLQGKVTGVFRNLLQ